MDWSTRVILSFLRFYFYGYRSSSQVPLAMLEQLLPFASIEAHPQGPFASDLFVSLVSLPGDPQYLQVQKRYYICE